MPVQKLNEGSTTCRFSGLESSSISNLAVDQTAIKAKSLPIPFLPKVMTPSPSLIGRVTEGPVSAPTIAKDLQALDDELATIQQSVNQAPSEDLNYIARIRNLIAEIMVQLNDIAAKDRKQIEEMEANYKKHTLNSGALQKEIGWNGFVFSIIALSVSFGTATMPQDYAYKEFLNVFASKCIPEGGNLVGAGKQAKMQQETSLASLILQKHSNKTQQGQSESSFKQMIEGMLQEVYRKLAEAARAG